MTTTKPPSKRLRYTEAESACATNSCVCHRRDSENHEYEMIHSDLKPQVQLSE